MLPNFFTLEFKVCRLEAIKKQKDQVQFATDFSLVENVRSSKLMFKENLMYVSVCAPPDER